MVHRKFQPPNLKTPEIFIFRAAKVLIAIMSKH